MEICSYIEELLPVNSIQDYPNALNGLQLENDGSVTRLASAVDASENTIDKAIREGADLLIVHHGLYWLGLRPLTGASYRKFKKAMDANLAIYSLHLPLDAYGEFGNSCLLGSKIGLENQKAYDVRGQELGAEGKWGGDFASLRAAVEKSVGGPARVFPYGPSHPVGEVAIITGGAGTDLESVYSRGIRTFISGEGSHWTAPLAEELGMNLIYAGHYATETFGVRALTQHLSQKFELPSVFIPNPTGL